MGGKRWKVGVWACATEDQTPSPLPALTYFSVSWSIESLPYRINGSAQAIRDQYVTFMLRMEAAPTMKTVTEINLLGLEYSPQVSWVLIGWL